MLLADETSRELLFAGASLKSSRKGDFLNWLFVVDSGLLLCSMLLLDLSLMDGLAELTSSKLLSLEDLIGLGDELRHLNFDLRSVDIERLPLHGSSSVSMTNFYLMVDIVELFVDEGLGKIVS